MSELDRETEGTTLAQGSPPGEKSRSTESSGVGERVDAILRAAEEAADQIKGEARRESAARLRKADADAEKRIGELTRTATEARREADEYARDMRMAVEAYAKKHRHDAEEEARRTTSEAESRAKSILESAQEDAQRIEEGARRHQKELRAETHRLEERRRQALHGVRELMAVLEGLLEEAHERPKRAADESLDETLSDRKLLGRRAR